MILKTALLVLALLFSWAAAGNTLLLCVKEMSDKRFGALRLSARTHAVIAALLWGWLYYTSHETP